MNYFEFYCGDYARDTAHLSLAEHGAFLMLLSAYYATEKPLPADLPALHRIARAMSRAEQVAVNSVAQQFFPIGDDGMRHNDRADKEVEKAQGRIDAARINGKKGGRPPKQKPNENPPGFVPVPEQEPSDKARHAPHAMQLHEGYVATPAAPAVALEGRFEGHDDPRPTPPNPAAPHAIALIAAGFQCTAMNPELVAFARDGGTVEHLTAIAAWPECHGKPAAYVLRIARRELAATAAPITGESHAAPRKLSASEQVRAAVAGRQRGREPAAAGR